MARASNEPVKLPTLNDVAARAQVSKQTISRVINNKDDVAPATRQRVQDAIRELGYQPNALARSLVTSKTLVIGLSVPNIDQPFFPQIVRGLEDAANEHGYSVFLCNAGGDPERERRALARLRGHRVAGVVSFNSRISDDAIEEVTGGHFPMLLINREVPGERGAIIWPGYEPGGYLATRHLLELGRRSIVFLGLERASNVDTDKLAGYQRALAEAGIPFDPELVVRPAVRRSRSFHDLTQSGYAAMAGIVERGLSFDGVFASNDLPAIGALRYAASHRIRIPGDVAVVGFGGAEVAGIVTPSLSTVSMPLYDMGATAFCALLDQINGLDHVPRQVEAQPALIVRESSVGRRRPAQSR